MVLTYKEIGRRFTVARGSESRRAVARALGISGEALRKIETAETHARNDRLGQLAKYYGLKLVVHLIDPRDQRAALWLRSIRFFAEADAELFNAMAAMITAWEAERDTTTRETRAAR